MCDIFITLPGGKKMPALGYGTWQVSIVVYLALI